MLRELHIANLAVIEDVTVSFDEGFNCITGQTGAGKSLVIGAFEVLLGLRSGGADLVRPGADEARVSGVFELHDEHVTAEVTRILDQNLDAGEQVLITRKLFASGRSSVSVNGHPATAAMVRGVGELLVDIHGQHDHQYLLKPGNQLTILDAFGKCSDLCERFAQLHGKLRNLRQKQSELSATGTLRRQQLELYEFQAQEIDAADPVEGEHAELEARHKLLSNLQRIQREAGGAFAALHESEGSVVERLHAITHVLTTLSELDESLGEVSEQVRSATLSLQEAAYELSRYLDRLDLDGGELTEVESRLNTINRLLSKYGDRHVPGEEPIALLLNYRRQIGQEIERLRAQDTDLSHIDRQIAALAEQLNEVGRKLTTARRAAVKKLRPLVEAQLAELGMGEATFDVTVEPAASEEGFASPSGFDQVEMLVQTNPGQPARPLRKIASGGEMSRIMLALKAILAQNDRISLLVFDEIDANIGGRLGSVIGRKLRELAGGGPTCHQVLCITHLPQIAAFAQRHLKIGKTVDGKGRNRTTRTTVTPLTGKARIEELAEMMAGKQASTTTLKQAQELIAAAG